MIPRPIDVDHLISEARGLRRLAVRLVGEAEADDVLQDAVAAGIEHAPPDDRSIRPWLVRVVRNFAAGRHRGAGRRTAREADVARREAVPSAVELVERIEVQRVVAEEVLRLDEPYRRAVLAVYFEGVAAEDYARGLGIPSATVRSWLKRGLDALRARLDRRFGGDRAAWSACLLPMARPEAALVPFAVAGGIVMKKVLIAACVVLALLLAWFVVAPGEPSSIGAVEPVAAFVAPIEIEESTATVPTPASGERAAVAATPEPTRTPQLRGRVVWLPDRAPAAGIGVFVGQPDRPDLGSPTFVESAADGTFRVDLVGEGDFTVGLDRARATKRLRFASGDAQEVELELPRGSTVRGRVLAVDGAPVAGADVYVTTFSELWSHRVARSDADGKYAVAGIGQGPRVFARAPGHSASASYLLQSAADPYVLDLWLGEAPGAIEGRVLDAGGNAVGGIAVALADSEESVTDPAGVRSTLKAAEIGATDARGAFAFRDVRPGRHVIAVHSLNRTVLTRAVEVRSGRTTRVELALVPTARLSGRVTNLEGSPCGGATVEVRRTDGTNALSWIMTDAEGRYDTGFVPAGRVRFAVRHQAGKLQIDSELAPGEERDWSPVLGAMAPIRGRVVGRDRRPLAGIEIVRWIPGVTENPRSVPAKLEATTDTAGRFELTGKVGRSIALAARRGDLVGVRFEVEAGQPESEFVFDPPSARIVGRIVDSAGAPARGLVVSGESYTIRPDAEGRFETPLLPSGPSSIRVSPYGVHNCHLLTIDLRPGETHSVGDLVLPERGTLVVALRARPGVDPSRMLALAYRLGHPDQLLSSYGVNLRRDWTTEGLPVGDYRLDISGGGAALTEKLFTIRAGATTLVDVEVHAGAPVLVEVAGERLDRLEIVARDAEGEVVGRREIYGHQPRECLLRLRAGRYEIAVTTQDGRTGSARIEVPDEPDAEQVVRVDVR